MGRCVMQMMEGVTVPEFFVFSREFLDSHAGDAARREAVFFPSGDRRLIHAEPFPENGLAFD